MKKGKSKGIVALVIIAIVAVVLLVTCPKKQAHLDAIDNVYAKAAADSQESGDLISTVGSYLGGKIAGTAVKQMLVVDDYFVCSVGTINAKDGKKPLSLGVLGHVFILDKDKLVHWGAE
ncbi:MAG: hypothetical protein PUF10_11070 [Bacteroidales bacterium]|nr:hypothetical protein [Bacteroidales bacterium]